LFTYLFIFVFIYLFIYLFTYLFIRSFVCLLVYLFVYLFIYFFKENLECEVVINEIQCESGTEGNKLFECEIYEDICKTKCSMLIDDECISRSEDCFLKGGEMNTCIDKV
jgi:hypothetical protein